MAIGCFQHFLLRYDDGDDENVFGDIGGLTARPPAVMTVRSTADATPAKNSPVHPGAAPYTVRGTNAGGLFHRLGRHVHGGVRLTWATGLAECICAAGVADRC